MNVSITSETNMEEFASFGSPRPSVQTNGLIATGAYNVVRAVRYEDYQIDPALSRTCSYPLYNSGRRSFFVACP